MYMPACTHLHFWGFLSQSSDTASWDLDTVLKLIYQMSLHVLIHHPQPQDFLKGHKLDPFVVYWTGR